MNEAKKVLKVKSYPYPTEEDANDALHGVASVPGYLFGYVDFSQKRTISFHEQTHADGPLPQGMASVVAICI